MISSREYYDQFDRGQLVDFLLQRDEYISSLESEGRSGRGVSMHGASSTACDDQWIRDDDEDMQTLMDRDMG